MKEEIIRLIKEGLYQDNLIKLIQLSDDHLNQDPNLFFILINIFRSLENEYEDQAITSDRYKEVMQLAPLLIDTLKEPSKQNLDKLITAFLG